MLVEGDSWFQLTGFSNLFMAVQSHLLCNALIMSKNGDTVGNMIGPRLTFAADGSSRLSETRSAQKNLALLRDRLGGAQLGIDLLFFSGGGNDVVDHLGHLVQPFAPGRTAAECIRRPQWVAQLAALRAGYERVLHLRDRVNPKAWIFCHEYGVPNLAKGAFNLQVAGVNLHSKGPWIKPKFQRLGYFSGTATAQELALMTEVIALLMKEFAAMLRGLPPNRCFVAPTQSVLDPSLWGDEMHLNQAGFRRAAATFVPTLKQLFPTHAS